MLFCDGAFGLVYACHVIEHIEWHDVEATIAEWARIIEPGGTLEVHTIDARRIMEALLRYEDTGEWVGPDPSWMEPLCHRDPYLWSVGRLLHYAKGGNIYQLHRTLITPAYLRRCFERAGLSELEPLSRKDMRGSRHHEFINLGLKGVKPC